jgi:hypothetical protein
VIVRWNKVEHAEFGLEVSASGAGEYQLLGNRSRINKVGIHHLGTKARGVIVKGNTAVENAIDCQDESKPPANHWQENVGATSAPEEPALCSVPSGMRQTGYDSAGHGKDHDKRQHKKHRKHHKKTEKDKKHPQDPCVCTLPWRF